MKKSLILVGIIMGSKSDWPIMQETSMMLDKLKISHESKIISAHRTPDQMYDYSKDASERGIEVIIAGAGGAAHLPVMTASLTSLPVIGVPIKSRELQGLTHFYLSTKCQKEYPSLRLLSAKVEPSMPLY